MVDTEHANEGLVAPLASDSEPTLDAASESGGIGLSSEQYSRSRRGMLDLINRLHSLGVNMDMDLPQIAVIGAQSAGKSSTIESISGIKLPRASGTCTRCPTECRLSRSSEPWKCVVTLRLTKDISGKALSPVQNIQFGEPIFNPEEVEDRLQRAQKAILNPSTPAAYFLGADECDSVAMELSFSPNFVSVAISGPKVADLSFCDLPGLIASVTKGGHEGDVKLIEDLLISYISKPSCVILLTIACESDFETQGAYKLAMQYDHERRRTIGVLTKPDRIARGDEQRWIRFLRNEEENLELGWYSVKQPDSVELKEGITWTRAREAEAEFFHTAEPWASLSRSDHQHLGTPNLVERLSDTLSELIRRRLPELQEELQGLITTTLSALAQLPEAPSGDPFAEMLQLIDSFTREFVHQLEGTPQPHGLIQRIHPCQEKFRMAIRATAPEFKPWETPDFPSLERRLMTPAPFLESEEADAASGASTDATDAQAPTQPMSTGVDRNIYIDQVMERAQSIRARELPGNYPYVVRTQYISETLALWSTPAKNFFAAVFEIVQKHVVEVVKRYFGRFSHSGLLGMIQLLIQEQIKFCQDVTADHLAWLLELEKQPFTLNAHYLSDYKEKFLSYYKAHRETSLPAPLRSALGQDKKQAKRSTAINQPSPFQFGAPTVRVSPAGRVSVASVDTPEEAPAEALRKILSGLSELGINGVTPSDLAKLLPQDQYSPALDIMAEVRAYFQVAYKRYVDNVPLCVDHDFVRGLGRRIHKALYEGLIKGDESYERCRRFLQESSVDASRREELNTKLARLNEGKRELLQMQMW